MERMSQQAVKTEPFDCQYAAWIVYVQLGGWLSILHLWVFAHRLSLLFPSFFFLIALKDEPSFCDRCAAFLPGNPRAASKYLLFFFPCIKASLPWWSRSGHLSFFKGNSMFCPLAASLTDIISLTRHAKCTTRHASSSLEGWIEKCGGIWGRETKITSGLCRYFWRLSEAIQ